MSAKFKIGSKVICVETETHSVDVGDTGTVIDDKCLPAVKWDKDNHVEPMYDEELEEVNYKKEIKRINNGRI